MNERFIRSEFGETSRVFKGFTLSTLLKQMSRLDSASNVSALTSVKRLRVAIEAETHGVKPVSRKHFLSQHVVTRAKRDVAAAVAFLSGKTDEVIDPEVKVQAERLKLIDDELKIFGQMVKEPTVKKMLEEVPHVKELIHEYIEKRSIKEILDEYSVPYDSDQLRSVRGFLTANSVDDSSKRGLASLARRYLLSKWQSTESKNIDGNMSLAAVDILRNDSSHLPKLQRDQVGSVRAFLRRIMDLEFQSMGRNALPEDLVLFPPGYKGSDEDVISAYIIFAEANYCPLTLKQYAQLAINEVPIRERVKNLLGFQYDSYSYNRMVDLDDKGLMFLENLLKKTNTRLNWNDLTFSTSMALRRIKQKMLDIKT